MALYFGKNDNYQPKTEWIKNMKLKFKAFPNKGYQMYPETEFAQMLYERVLKNGTITLYPM